MKRRALLKHLRLHGKHTVFWNPKNRQTSTVPRHTEIQDPLATKICRDLGIPRP